MASVSSQIFMQAIDDGASLHGLLQSTAPLVQMYQNGTAIPDWTYDGVTDNPDSPIIYLSLRSGGAQVAGDVTNYHWTYNGTTIQFDNSGYSTNVQQGVFKLVNNYPSAASPVPAIRIVGNLANKEFVDQDIIGFEGECNISGAAVPVSLYASVRLATLSPSGYGGVILPATLVSGTFPNGTFTKGGSTVFDKEGVNKDVYLYVKLYSVTGELPKSAFTTKWYISDEDVEAVPSPFNPAITISPITVDGTPYWGIHLVESNIEDHEMVEVEFFKDGQKVVSTFIEVEDEIDDFMMYISTQISRNGSAASDVTSDSGKGSNVYLRSTDSVNIRVRMGQETNPNVTLEDYKWFYIKFAKRVDDLDNTTFLGEFASGPSNVLPVVVDPPSSDPAYGWRPMSGAGTQSYGTVNVSYDNLKVMGGRMTGFLLARTDELQPKPAPGNS